MKRILLALVIASATMLSFNSCTKEYITNNDVLPGRSFYKDLAGGSAWTAVSGSSNLFEQIVVLPELDNLVFEDGHVLVSVGIRTTNGVQEFVNIPNFNRPLEGFTYDVSYRLERLVITARSSTGSAPGPLVAKIILTDAEVGN